MTTAHTVELVLAAQRMRRRAQNANTVEARRPYGDRGAEPVPQEKWGELVDNYLGGSIGKHCAALTPAVALAVADLLEAAVVDQGERTFQQLAVEVAHAYLRVDRG